VFIDSRRNQIRPVGNEVLWLCRWRLIRRLRQFVETEPRPGFEMSTNSNVTLPNEAQPRNDSGDARATANDGGLKAIYQRSREYVRPVPRGISA
jgi:hypothetical protein